MKGLKLLAPRKTAVTLRRFGGINLTTDGNSGGNAYAEFSYNFDCEGGDLKSGIGAKTLYSSLPEKPKAHWFYKRDDALYGSDDRYIFMGASGKFYECKIGVGSFTEITGLSFTSPPIGVLYNYHGEDAIIFASASEGAYLYDGSTVTQIEDAPPISSACIHYERLFATSDGGKSLWFSDDFDPMNWSVSLTEAGFIDMSGKGGEALKVLSFSDALFVFRSYGITRITAYGDQTQFSVSDLFISSGKIIRDSVTLCGDKIIFCASDGFYSFNGVSASKILRGLDGVIDFSKGAKGEYYDGKAYFKVKAKYSSSYYDCLLVLDAFKGSYYLAYGMNVKDLCLINGKNAYSLALICGEEQKIFELSSDDEFLSVALPKLWKSKYCDFGILKERKVLSKISLYTDTDITLTVDGGNKVSVYSIKGGTKRKTVTPKMSVDNFSLEIYSDKKNARVSAMTLEFEYYR